MSEIQSEVSEAPESQELMSTIENVKNVVNQKIQGLSIDNSLLQKRILELELENALLKKDFLNPRFLAKKIIEFLESSASISDRRSLYPIEDAEEFKYFELQQKAHWVPKEVRFVDDHTNFCMLKPEQQEPLIWTLATFQVLDGGVIDALTFSFLLEAKTLEEKAFYIIQLNMEMFHAESYARQLEAVCPNPKKREEIIKTVDNQKWLRDQDVFVSKYITDTEICSALRHVARAATEGIGFSGLFAVVFYYKKMPNAIDIPGVTSSNEFIARDEGIHRDHAVHRHRRFCQEDKRTYPEESLAILLEYLVIKRACNEAIVKNPLPGLTAEKLNTFDEFLTDNLLEDLGYARHFGVSNPLPYMSSIGGIVKNNGFEKQGTSYARPEVSTKVVDWTQADF